MLLCPMRCQKRPLVFIKIDLSNGRLIPAMIQFISFSRSKVWGKIHFFLVNLWSLSSFFLRKCIIVLQQQEYADRLLLALHQTCRTVRLRCLGRLIQTTTESESIRESPNLLVIISLWAFRYIWTSHEGKWKNPQNDCRLFQDSTARSLWKSYCWHFAVPPAGGVIWLCGGSEFVLDW